MAARAERLGDDPGTWEDDLRDLEVLVVVHAQSAEALEAEAGRWERELRAEGSGLELAHVQPAGLLGEQREHFGFTDGFSQPAIEGVAREDVRGQGIPYKRVPWWPLSRTQWRAVKPGEFVLGYEDEDRGPRARAARALRPQRELHGVAQAAPGRRRLPRPARRAGAAPGARRGARRGQARRALARRQPARRCAPTAPTRRSATTSSAPTTSATATTSSACAARAAPTCGAPTRATRSAGRVGSPRATGSCAAGCPTGPALPEGAAGRRRGARAALRLPAGLDRAPVRDRPVAVVQRRQRLRPGPRGRPDHRARRRRGAPHHRGRPAARGRAAAQLRRVPRRRVPRRPGRSAPCGRCPRSDAAGHRRAGAR